MWWQGHLKYKYSSVINNAFLVRIERQMKRLVTQEFTELCFLWNGQEMEQVKNETAEI